MSGRRSAHDSSEIPEENPKHHGLLHGKHGHKTSTARSDLNMNGVPDKLESRTAFHPDLSRSTPMGPTSLETNRTTFASNDLNANGFPDQLERMNLGTTHRAEVILPAKIIEKPAAIHEEIRREQIEEIQPIVNVEKVKTEVHQITQPLVDREVKAVGVMQKTLPTEILPQITQPTLGMRSAEDFSTVTYKDQAKVIERPAMYVETEKKQIIEEIQPVIYKETIVPTLIKETKPIYQTVIEGTTFVHEVLPAQQLKSSAWSGRSWGASTDLNANGIPDQFEGGAQFRSNDLNRNGVPDQFEGGSQFRSNDLNRNGVPDQLERGTHFKSNDLNRNGIPDQIEKGPHYQSANLHSGVHDQLGRKVTPSASANVPFTSTKPL